MTVPFTRAHLELRRLFIEFGPDVVAAQPWMNENDRWNEFLFALLTRTTKLPEDVLRPLVAKLDDLQLLEAGELASMTTADNADGQARWLADIMMEHGVDQADADRSVRVLRDAAKSLVTNHDGKLQRYLRAYGEQMLRELDQHFAFEDLSADDAGAAMTLWLQNALGMPLSLIDEDLRAFCRHRRLTPSELIQAADSEDVNLALVDDLVRASVLVDTALREP